MGLFDTVLQDLVGGVEGATHGQNPSAMRGMLTSLFAGVPGGQNSSGVGGLQGLVNRFQSAGLGSVVQSWMDPGQQNRDISPEQLHQALGNEHVQAMAAETGIPEGQLLAQLAQFLPGLVGKLAPNGQMPPAHQDPTLSEPNQGGSGAINV